MKKLILLLVSVVVLTVQNNAQTVSYDGYTYHTLTLGSQTWLKENLRTSKFSNGDYIPYIKCIKTTNNGINENKEIRDIKPYPNPVVDNMTIELAKSIKNGSISIYNQHGQLVYNQTVESMKIDVNTSNLVNGLYFIKIDGLEGSATREFVKQ
jgi:hypothetical protein